MAGYVKPNNYGTRFALKYLRIGNLTSEREHGTNSEAKEK